MNTCILNNDLQPSCTSWILITISSMVLVIESNLISLTMKEGNKNPSSYILGIHFMLSINTQKYL